MYWYACWYAVCMVTTTLLGWCHHGVSHNGSSLHCHETFKIIPHIFLTVSYSYEELVNSCPTPIRVFPHGRKVISYLHDLKISEISGVKNRILWRTVTEFFNIHKTGTVPRKLRWIESPSRIVFWRSATLIRHAT